MVILACLATLVIPIVLPSLRLLYCAPFLIYVIYERKLSQILWIALFLGLFMDLFSSGTRIGFFALTFLLAALFVSQFKLYFFKDRLSTLPLMTFLFSATLSILQVTLSFLFQRDSASYPISFSGNWIWWNVIAMPACDALFAFAISTAALLMRMFQIRPRML
ncbi:MAG: rod shape-determining protein MreD [Parachlamydia sp.]|nr:rod shape-determining protein MreD [Parachlamydia sp.]